jgi:hypothetical protein
MGATISGGGKHGGYNAISGDYGTIGGGYANLATEGSTIGGGVSNFASRYGTVGGGTDNTTIGDLATVAGGIGNEVRGYIATVGGGGQNTAQGQNATVPGGYANSATGNYSFAAGSMAHVFDAHHGAMLFSDDSDLANSFDSAAADEFAVRCAGGARFVTATDNLGDPRQGVTLPAGGGSWSSISDENLKENFTQLNSDGILERLSQVPITEWNYKAQDPSIRHVGPMAQDFHEAFHLGEDERHIST